MKLLSYLVKVTYYRKGKYPIEEAVAVTAPNVMKAISLAMKEVKRASNGGWTERYTDIEFSTRATVMGKVVNEGAVPGARILTREEVRP